MPVGDEEVDVTCRRVWSVAGAGGDGWHEHDRARAGADGAALAVEAGAAGGGWGGRRGAERNGWESKRKAATSLANKQKAFAGRL